MSTKKGAGQKRTGPQKHQNTSAWKFDMHKDDPKTKLIQNVVVTNCCEKCTSVIEWKRKYGKYKPLTQPAKCIRCQEKRVKFAYHQYCSVCVSETRGCAKCGQTEIEVVNKPQPSQAESARMESELQKELKLLPERKRRTFMRYLQQQEKKLRNPKSAKTAEEKHQGDESDVEEDTELDENLEVSNLAPKTLHDVHQMAFEKLKVLRQKYGGKNDGEEDLDDFDLEDLEDFDLSEDGDDDDTEDED